MAGECETAALMLGHIQQPFFDLFLPFCYSITEPCISDCIDSNSKIYQQQLRTRGDLNITMHVGESEILAFIPTRYLRFQLTAVCVRNEWVENTRKASSKG